MGGRVQVYLDHTEVLCSVCGETGAYDFDGDDLCQDCVNDVLDEWDRDFERECNGFSADCPEAD